MGKEGNEFIFENLPGGSYMPMGDCDVSNYSMLFGKQLPNPTYYPGQVISYEYLAEA